MKKPTLVLCAGLGLFWSSSAIAGDEPPVRGEGNALSYLRTMHTKIHHLWADSFLVMAEGQLPKDHPINVPSRATELEVMVTSEGKLAQVKVAKPSGSSDFDNSATEVIKAAAPFGIAYQDLLSDDGKVHVLWTLARDDRRCSGARVEVTTSPLEEAVPMLVAQGREKLALARLQAADDKVRPAGFTKFARAWLDRYEDDKELGLQVAEANALAGDLRAAGRLRRAIADAGTMDRAERIAQGLASLKVAVCPAIKESLARAAGKDKKPVPAADSDPVDEDAQNAPSAVPDLDDKEFLAQIQAQDARERVLRLLVEGTDGVCLSFAIAVAKDKTAKAEDRALALWALGHSEDAEGKATIRPLLHDGNPTVVSAAIWAEALAGANKGAVFRLIPFLRDKSIVVRSAAAAALVRVGGEEVLPQLFQVWREKDPAVYVALAGELADLSGEASAQMLARLVRKDDGAVRLAAARGLAARRDDFAAKVIAELAKGANGELKFLAATVLDPEKRLAAAAAPEGYTWTESFLALARGNGKLAAVDWVLAQFPKIEPATRIYLMGTWLVATRPKS